MRVFDQIDSEALERREFHLGILAILMNAVLSIGLATFMYPTVFSHPLAAEDVAAQRAFFAFCALSILMVSYLINRQFVIRQLRRKVVEEQNQIVIIRNQASADLLKTLPGMGHFLDRLAMEFRRCANSNEPLSMLLFLVSINKDLTDAREIATTYGDAAKMLFMKVPKGESIYGFRSGAFGIVLAGCNAVSAKRASERFTRGLEEARLAGGPFSFEVRIISYPEDVGTAREMEHAVRSILPEGGPELPEFQESGSPMDASSKM